MRDHERVEGLIAIHALDGLDPGDEQTLRREMADHGPDCAECRRLEAEYGEVAARLALALDPIPARVGFEDQVVANALRTSADTSPGPRPRRERRRLLGRLELRPLVAVAASIVLFAGGWALGALMSGPGVAVPPGARVVVFEGQGDAALSVAYRPGEAGVYLLGSGLEPQPKGGVYELWSFRGQTPVRGGCFRPTGDGSVFAFLPAEIGATRLMAVTVERSSCPSAPTSAPILSAEVSA